MKYSEKGNAPVTGWSASQDFQQTRQNRTRSEPGSKDKHCPKCEKVKPLEDFSGRSICEQCYKALWPEYVAGLSWEKGNLDASSYNACLRGASLGMPGSTVVAEIQARIQAAGDHPKQQKIQSQWRRAAMHVKANPGDWQSLQWAKPLPKPVYQPEKLKQVAARLPEVVDAEYLEARSKFTCWNRSAAGFLHKLYLPGEKVVVLNVYKSQGCGVWQHPGIVGDLSALNHLRTGQYGVWYMAQPVHGEFVYADRLKSEYNPEGKSRRCEECVTSWRYSVIESDKANPNEWLRALVRLCLPVSAIYESGKKSIHALVRVDAESKAEWDEIIRGKLLPVLTVLGACSETLTAVRLTRLPNCRREETGQLQRLLYLDPEPDDEPICQKRLRGDLR
jgi:hypothetical protein